MGVGRGTGEESDEHYEESGKHCDYAEPGGGAEAGGQASVLRLVVRLAC